MDTPPGPALRREDASEGLVGQRLGRFEVLAKLGAGGMGEVFLAHDPSLERKVALKLLPAHLAHHPDRIQRFRREAIAASALNHPNILTVHEVVEVGGREVLVSELVDGSTLRQRLGGGRLPVTEALDVAVQVARGLEAAHGAGLVHRDVKPENVMVRRDGLVKILDFGLAKSLEPLDSGVTTPMPTKTGIIVGTAPYLSPEQARGQEATRQSDVWALGCVAYEALTGRRAFGGGTAGGVIADILSREPDWEALPADTPPLARSLLRRCLHKDPGQRLRDVGDARLELEEAIREPGFGAPTEARPKRRMLPLATAALALAIALLVTFLVTRRTEVAASPAAVPARFELPHPTGGRFYLSVESSSLALSPDGSTLAFVTLAPGGPKGPASAIWLRHLADLESRPVPGTEDASSVFWSPDGRDIGFVAEGKLKRIPVAGGVPIVLCDVQSGAGTSGSWGPDSILFAPVQGDAIYGVPVTGGDPAQVLLPDPDNDIHRVAWPWWLPDGERFLFFALRGDGTAELRLAAPGGGSRRVAPLASRVETVGPDLVVFNREGGLFAQRLDADRAELVGPLTPLAPAVQSFGSTGWAAFTASPAGSVAVATHHDVHRLLVVDLAGRVEDEVGGPVLGVSVASSPDGRRAIVGRLRPGLATYDLWMLDLERGLEAPLTDAPGTEVHALWLPGGREIVYSTTRQTIPNLVKRDLASGAEVALVPPGAFQIAVAVTPDGRQLIYRERDQAGFELLAAPFDHPGQPTSVLRAGVAVLDAAVSPDGKILAYVSRQEGRPELFVRLLEGGESLRVSANGAWAARFAVDGETLYFTTGDRHVAAVPVRADSGLELGVATVLFPTQGLGWMAFDVLPDGRFLALVRESDGTTEPITIVTGWAPRTGDG